jgi:hypothetical protein
VQLLGDLDGLAVEEVASWRNVGVKTVRELLALLGGPVPPADSRLSTVPTVPVVDPEAPYPTLMAWVDHLCEQRRNLAAARDRRILVSRLALDGEKCATLEQLARQYEVSRERIRQIVEKLQDCACGSEYQGSLQPLVQRVVDTVTAHGGLMPKEDLVRVSLVRGPEGDKLRHATSFIDFCSRMPVWLSTGLKLVGGGLIQKGDVTDLVGYLASPLSRVATDNADERLGEGYWSIGESRLAEALAKHCTEQPAYAPLETLSHKLLELAADLGESRDRIRHSKGRWYSAPLWRLRFGTVVELVEEVILRAAAPMHFTAVAAETGKWRAKALSERSALGAIERAPKLLLWDHGTYTHRHNVRLPHKVLLRIEAALRAKLETDVPFFCVHGCFEEYRDELRLSGLTNSKALYGVLRERAPRELGFPRYPQVVRAGEKGTPVAVALEQFAEAAGGPFPTRDLLRYAHAELGITTKKMIHAHLTCYGVPNVLRVGPSLLCHRSHLGVDSL